MRRTRTEPTLDMDIRTARPRTETLQTVEERDIDLLLLEEVIASPAFRRLVLGAVAQDLDASDASVEAAALQGSDYLGDWRFTDPESGEAMDAWGETDLDLLFTVTPTGGGAPTTVLILLENKIDAPFQPEQPARYRARARAERASGRCAIARTLLVAPEDYQRSGEGAAMFDARLSYESIRDHFLERADASLDDEARCRLQHRAWMMDRALGKSRISGGPKVAHPGTTAFRTAFHALSLAIAPELGALWLNPKGHWAGDAWIEYRQALPESERVRADIIVKTNRARVDLQLRGWAAQEATLRQQLEAVLWDGMFVPPVSKGTKSLMVAIAIPPLDHQGELEPQRNSVLTAIREVQVLREWFVACLPELERLAEER